MSKYQSGFVNIMGYPNVGKSTLLNSLIGEKISIVTPKVQTTRHRILGIMTEKNYQVIFSDTPGILEPKYELHKAMQAAINESVSDADIILYLIEPLDDKDKHADFIRNLISGNTPFFLIINKIDLCESQKILEEVLERWSEVVEKDKIIPVSALHDFNLKKILFEIIKRLPEHPAYYPDEMITDRSERFITSEIIREKIFLKFRQEIPYSTEVVVTSFKDEEKIINIDAEIVVNTKSQKPILIGKGGLALKAVGTAARADIEAFFGKQVFLQLYVKVRENWRDRSVFLKQFGY